MIVYIKSLFRPGLTKKQKALIELLFDSDFYLNSNADVRSAGIDALSHYFRYGFAEGRVPTPYFDSKWYVTKNGLVNCKRPFEHFLTIGWQNHLTPNPLIDPKWYLSQYEDVRSAGIDPITHFLENGWQEGRNPSRYFDTEWYVECYGTSIAPGVNPIQHFLREPHANGRNPGPWFSCRLYLSRYSDVAQSKLPAYWHYLMYGQGEGREPLPTSDVGYESSAVDDVVLVDLPTFDEELPSQDEQVADNFVEYPSGLPAIEGFSYPETCQLLSLDVWSTLLHRECAPDEIKFQSARYLYLTAFPLIKPAFRNVVLLYRTRLRSENVSAPNSEFEYRFDDAVEAWLELVLGADATPAIHAKLAKELYDHEQAAEFRATKPDSFMLSYLQQSPVMKIYASDFYMPGRFIEKLLGHHGIGHMFVRGYVSSDTFETKRSGAMFARIQADFGLKPETLFHIGDNEVADVARPRELGIKAFHYVNPREINRMAEHQAAFNALLDGELGLHYRRLQAILGHEASNIPADLSTAEDRLLFQIGNRFAPLAYSYILSILEAAVQYGNSKIYFFMREGIFLQEIFNAIIACDPYNTVYPESGLLAVSRRATFAASLEEPKIQHLMRLWNQYSSQSIKGFALTLNLDLELTKRIATSFGLNIETIVQYPWQNKAFLHFFKSPELTEHLRQCIKMQSELLKEYLAQAGVYGEHKDDLVIVDIGWRGTIQDNISYLLKRPIRGHYLALFQFFNEQPAGSRKIGWLSDANHGTTYQLQDQVAPLEMLFNGPGGSVSGYRKTAEGIVEPIREVIAEEEAVIAKLTAFRRGVLAAIPILSDYTRLHGLLASDLLPMARRIADLIIQQPPTAIADIFAELHHNETFGTGEIDKMMVGDFIGDAHEPAEIHYTLNNWINSQRWKAGAVRQSKLQAWLHEAPLQTQSLVPLAVSKQRAPAILKARGNRVSVYVPAPLQASGGHRTIYNIVRRLAEVGFAPNIFLESEGAGLGVIEDYLAGTKATLHSSWYSHIPATLAFATIAHSAQYVKDQVNSDFKGYLVQDAEALFNPIGDTYVIGENSYTLGLHHFTIGNWLTHVINTRYGAVASPSGLGVDTKVYHNLDEPRERAVCMLYQPDKPRRGNNLALGALRLMKRRNPDIKIYMYGSDNKPSLNFEVEHLGLIHDLQELNKLYNKCTAGLCISLSNPSRIPFEMAAAGCAPVDVYRYNNLLDQQEGISILAYQSPSSIALALESAMNADAAVIADRSASMAKRMRGRTVEWESDSIVAQALNLIEGKMQHRWGVKRTYQSDPILDSTDMTPAVLKFCEWERLMADM